jgi:hypothetical protein
MHTIKEQIQLLDDGHFEQWHGLGDEWTRQGIEAFTHPGLDCRNYFLAGKSISQCLLPLKTQPQPLQIFIGDGEKIRLLRIEDARPAISLPDMLKLLGEPGVRRSLRYPDFYAPATQWIYATKGITLYVLDESPGSTIPLAAVAFYEPTTADDFLANLGGRETMTFFTDDPDKK